MLHDQQKKKNVSHYELESVNELSYSQLQKAFQNLHKEVVNTLKNLASNKRIFSHLEAKILETEKQMKALKQFMVDVQKVKNEDEEPSWFSCETCHIWKKEVNTLKAKLNKSLEP